MKKVYLIVFAIIVLTGIVSWFVQRHNISYNAVMKIESPAFKNGDRIPAQYTCDGADINPPLLISDVPAGAKSLAIIMDDPDASRGKTWDHWLVWNIAPDTGEVKEGITPPGAITGSNSWPKASYGGPCPPAEHRYFFKLYALDIMLDTPAGSPKEILENAMNGHIIAKAELMGRYSKK
jgi:Raf kinase inhibitor-like YbhB/YbcL family protein